MPLPRNAVKYIFSANPGRAGSGYLYTLLCHAKNVAAFHEPEPIMNREPMIAFLNGNPTPLHQRMSEKIEAIQRACARPGCVYAETNHTFIRGFGWLLPGYLPAEEIGVVILRRDREAVAKSLHRLKANAFNNNGRGWLIHVNAKNRIVPRPQVPFLLARYYYYRFLHRVYYFLHARPRLTFGALRDRSEPATPYALNMQLLCWYVDEVYAMTERYKEVFPTVRYYEVETDTLNDIREVQRMFDYFGLEPAESLTSVVGMRVNTKPEFVVSHPGERRHERR